MSNVWEKFDEKFDTEGLKNDAKEAAENGGGDFKEVPHGKYEVVVHKLVLGETKNNKPKQACQLKIISDCDVKGQLIFADQVMSSGFGIHLASEFLRSLDTGIEVNFDTFSQWNQLLMDVKEAVDIQKLEYAISYEADEKNSDFSRVKITEVFQAE